MIPILLFYFLRYLLCSDCPTGIGSGELSSEISVSSLQITTFNVYWLFNKTNYMIPWDSQKECIIHANRISTVLDSFSESHIINFCEVENCDIVDYVRKKTIKSEEYHTFLKQGTDTGTGQNVAMLSKFSPLEPLTRTENRFEYPLSWSNCGYNSTTQKTTDSSKHYFSLFKLKGGRLMLVVGLHLKAIPNKPDCCSKREAQAMVIIEKVKEYQNTYKNLLIVILGDFNDYDGSFLDKNDDVPISQVLSKMKSELSLKNVFEKVTDKNNRFSYWWDEHDLIELLDHILVSNELFEVLESVKVETDLYPSGNYNISDHWPVTVRFSMSKIYSSTGDGSNKSGNNKLTVSDVIFKIVIPIIGGLVIVGIICCGLFLCCGIIAVCCGCVFLDVFVYFFITCMEWKRKIERKKKKGGEYKQISEKKRKKSVEMNEKTPIKEDFEF